MSQKKVYTCIMAHHFLVMVNARIRMTNIGRITVPTSLYTIFVETNLTVDFTGMK